MTTFAVPDMQGRLAAGINSTYPLGAKYGSETVKLGSTTLAAHNHTIPSGGATTTTGGLSYDNADPSLALRYIIATQGNFPQQPARRVLTEGEQGEAELGGEATQRRLTGESPFFGEIQLFAGSFAPTGWALCNGQILPIASNTALFALLGTYYGGNGQTTFALPGAS